MKIIRPITVTDSVLSSSNISEDDYEAWVSTTTYQVEDRVMIVTDNYHKIFEAAASANTNHDPVTDAGSWWTLVGSTNKWRAFDNSPSEQTSFNSQVTFTLSLTERLDTVALMNLYAASVTITQTDAVDGLVYTQTASLISTSSIQNWYSYFFEPIVHVTDFVATDLFPYAASTIVVTLNAPAETVLLGECVVGLSRDMGFTQYGASVGIQDYSIKEADTWGNYTIVERAFSKRADFTVWIESSKVDEVQSLLASYRAAPIVYVGSDDYNSTLVYGFYKDFAVEIVQESISVCTISVEGLV